MKNRHIVNRDEVVGIASSVVPPVLNSGYSQSGMLKKLYEWIPLGLSDNGDDPGLSTFWVIQQPALGWTSACGSV